MAIVVLEHSVSTVLRAKRPCFPNVCGSQNSRPLSLLVPSGSVEELAVGFFFFFFIRGTYRIKVVHHQWNWNVEMLLVRRATVAHDDVHANGNEWYVLPIYSERERAKSCAEYQAHTVFLPHPAHSFGR